MAETLRGRQRDLFLTIAHCPIISAIRDNSSLESPCRTIVELQRDRPAKRHIAEPWIGHIDRAPILFVGSNPGWSHDDQGLGAVDDDGLVDIHINYFGGGLRPYSAGGIRGVGPDGMPEKGWVHYWAFAQQRATELLGPAVVPGESYALTEAVHCNSRTEASGATRAALSECGPRYLERVLDIAGARVIIVVGDVAAQAFRGLGIPPEERVVGPVRLGGRERVVVFLPHPNQRGRSKSLRGNVPTYLEMLRQVATAAGPATSA
jgi:uracil-DNA glycosylase